MMGDETLPRPVKLRLSSRDRDPTSDTIKASKGLGFPVVALPGVAQVPATAACEEEAARVFYVAATQATQRLVLGVTGVWEALGTVKYSQL